MPIIFVGKYNQIPQKASTANNFLNFNKSSRDKDCIIFFHPSEWALN